MPHSHPRSLIPRLTAAVATGALCAALGWSLTQHSKLALAPVAIAGMAALMSVLAELGWVALWSWAPLSVLLYPLAGHLPGGKYVTFDRIWIIGMTVLLLTRPGAGASARPSRRALLGLGVLATVIGVRSIATPASSLYPIRVWFDSLVLPLILFLLVRRVTGQSGGGADHATLSLMIAGGLLGVIGVTQHFAGFTLTSSARFDGNIGEVRIAGPYAAPETYGLAVLMCLAASLHWLLSRPRDGLARAAATVVVLLELLAIFYTYFRVGWIGALVILVAAFGLRPGRVARMVVALCVTGLVIVPLFLLFETLPGVKQRVTNTQNIYVRFATYRQGWEIFTSSPLFGVGAQRYTDVAGAVPPVYVHGQPGEPYPHSSLLEVMAEDGIVGLLALLAAGAGTWRLLVAFGRSSRSGPDAVLAGVLWAAALTYALYSLTLTMLPYDPSNQMFAILLGVAAGRLDRRAAGRHERDLPSMGRARPEAVLA